MRTEAITPELLEILRELMTMDELSGFSLGGGTSLALRFGHRRSVDIDLFSVAVFNPELILQRIHTLFAETDIYNRTTGSLCLGIRGVKVDILHHGYPELEPPSSLDGIRCVSLKDIAAMKVNAVTNRGSKKDFSDLLLLHENGLPLDASVDHFCLKYGHNSRFLAIRSLQFFEDTHLEPDPVYLNGWRWETVEKEMTALAQGLA